MPLKTSRVAARKGCQMTENKTPSNDIESSQSFENFKRLAKDLLSVPKKELDKKLAEYERNKKHSKLKRKK